MDITQLVGLSVRYLQAENPNQKEKLKIYERTYFP